METRSSRPPWQPRGNAATPRRQLVLLTDFRPIYVANLVSLEAAAATSRHVTSRHTKTRQGTTLRRMPRLASQTTALQNPPRQARDTESKVRAPHGWQARPRAASTTKGGRHSKTPVGGMGQAQGENRRARGPGLSPPRTLTGACNGSGAGWRGVAKMGVWGWGGAVHGVRRRAEGARHRSHLETLVCGVQWILLASTATPSPPHRCRTHVRTHQISQSLPRMNRHRSYATHEQTLCT